MYVQSDLEEATEQMITLAAQQQYQQDLASGVAQRVVEQYAGSTLAGSKQTVKSAIDALNSTIACENFASLCTWNDNLDAMQAWKVGKTVQLIFRAKSGSTHAESEVIVDIPNGYRPSATVYGTIFLAGGVSCVIQISTAGRCILYTAPSYPTGRIYGNILYTLQ